MRGDEKGGRKKIETSSPEIPSDNDEWCSECEGLKIQCGEFYNNMIHPPVKNKA